MSRHSSSPVEQLLGLLFLAAAGVVGVVIAAGRFVWRMYTEVPTDFDDSQQGDGQP